MISAEEVDISVIRSAGYVVLPDLFSHAETAEIASAIESVHDGLLADQVDEEIDWPEGHRMVTVGGATVSWEKSTGSSAVRSIVGVTELHPALTALWSDPRLTEPVGKALGVPADEVGPFTDKVNFKRPGGDGFPWHHDYAYWYGCVGTAARDVITAFIALDHAHSANGGMLVLPGSHLTPAPLDRASPSELLADQRHIDADRAVAVDLTPGSVLLFDAQLVHASGPNPSGDQRRALIMRFQPADRPLMADRPYDAARLADLP